MISVSRGKLAKETGGGENTMVRNASELQTNWQIIGKKKNRKEPAKLCFFLK